MSNLEFVSSKSERRAARSVVAEYHVAQLSELVHRVGNSIDRYRAGELDACDIDRVLFEYSRAAKELWKFCNYLPVEVAAGMSGSSRQVTGGYAGRQESGDGWWLHRCERLLIRRESSDTSG